MKAEESRCGRTQGGKGTVNAKNVGGASMGNQATLSESGEARTTFKMISVLALHEKRMGRSRPGENRWHGLLPGSGR